MKKRITQGQWPYGLAAWAINMTVPVFPGLVADANRPPQSCLTCDNPRGTVSPTDRRSLLSGARYRLSRPWAAVGATSLATTASHPEQTPGSFAGRTARMVGHANI